MRSVVLTPSPGFLPPTKEPKSFGLGEEGGPWALQQDTQPRPNPPAAAAPSGEEAGLGVLGPQAALSPQPRSEWPHVRTKAGEWSRVNESCQHTQAHTCNTHTPPSGCLHPPLEGLLARGPVSSRVEQLWTQDTREATRVGTAMDVPTRVPPSALAG